MLPKHIEYTPMVHLPEEKRHAMKKIWDVPEEAIIAMERQYLARKGAFHLDEATFVAVQTIYAPERDKNECDNEEVGNGLISTNNRRRIQGYTQSEQIVESRDSVTEEATLHQEQRESISFWNKHPFKGGKK